MSKKVSTKTAALNAAGEKATTAAQLVDRLESGGASRDDAVGVIIELRTEKKVSVTEPKPYASLASYAWSPYSIWFWSVLAAVAASFALIFASSGVALYARYVFGSALVLFLPGYSLIEALYPKRELDELTRFALSIGLSLALVPLTGLVLNYTPFGIRLLPVTISISGLTVVFLIIALVRKHAYYKLAKGVL